MRTLYRARAVHTQSHPATGEWVLVDDRHVQRVGAGEPPVADRVVDLPGATITPGFVDTHVHLTPTGIALGNVEVEKAGDRGELLAIARDRAGQATPTVWLQGFDETRWTDHGLPSLAELDEITSRPLVIWRADGHVCLANTAAIVQGGVGDLPGTERAGGPWTGRVRMEANDRLHRWFALALSDHEVQELQLRAAALAAARGITSLHEMSMPAGHGLRDLEVVLSQRERLPVDVLPIVATMDVPQIMDLRLPTIGGDLPVDGSIGARTAALGAPYAGGDGEGVTYYEDDVLEGFFLSGHAASVQPAFDAAWGHPGGLYELGVGEERATAMNPFRTMLDRGMEVGAGSDTPVTPLEPMRTVEALERHHHPAQRLTRAEAIRVSTIGGARLAHQEGKKGTLEPGSHADLVAWDDDPFTAVDVATVRPILTVSLGREVFSR
ncbi:MAG: amidohydrolase family protein [Actinomycetota bacterium]